jgi:hypothetical protein
MFGKILKRKVSLEPVPEFTEDQLKAALANQHESSVVRAIMQVLDDEAMESINASLDQEQPERVCASHAGGATALMDLKSRLMHYMRSKPKTEESNG